jgi:hypothetical protein
MGESAGKGLTTMRNGMLSCIPFWPITLLGLALLRVSPSRRLPKLKPMRIDAFV